MRHIEASRNNSQNKLRDLREALKTQDDSFIIVVGGSIARLEASEESDIDYFFFGENDEGLERAKKHIENLSDAIKNIVGKAPSIEGAFGQDESETLTQLIANIGGNDDGNKKITRRILFLLEGAWLTSADKVEVFRREVLNRYVSPVIENRQLCRFLLNDIIRYYRTICVDFEFKTVEGGKSWGLRYIKLRFSRQLLYFSGLIAVAETVDMPREEKITRLLSLMQKSPLERIEEVCGKDKVLEAFHLYDYFLESISDPNLREELDSITLDPNTRTDRFNQLRTKSKLFTVELSKILRSKYPADHLIHMASIF